MMDGFQSVIFIFVSLKFDRSNKTGELKAWEAFALASSKSQPKNFIAIKRAIVKAVKQSSLLWAP